MSQGEFCQRFRKYIQYCHCVQVPDWERICEDMLKIAEANAQELIRIGSPPEWSKEKELNFFYKTGFRNELESCSVRFEKVFAEKEARIKFLEMVANQYEVQQRSRDAIIEKLRRVMQSLPHECNWAPVCSQSDHRNLNPCDKCKTVLALQELAEFERTK